MGTMEEKKKTPTTTLKEARDAAIRHEGHVEMESKLQALKSELEKDKLKLDELLTTEFENDDETRVDERVELEYETIPRIEKEIKRLEDLSQYYRP